MNDAFVILVTKLRLPDVCVAGLFAICLAELCGDIDGTEFLMTLEIASPDCVGIAKTSIDLQISLSYKRMRSQ